MGGKEKVHTGQGADFVDGGSGDDTLLHGDNDEDTILGGPGQDAFGGDESDKFRGGPGVDTECLGNDEAVDDAPADVDLIRNCE
jgi:Ca2+-binding RTX toxin-like protein